MILYQSLYVKLSIMWLMQHIQANGADFLFDLGSSCWMKWIQLKEPVWGDPIWNLES
jgi:hypothetical protein